MKTTAYEPPILRTHRLITGQQRPRSGDTSVATPPPAPLLQAPTIPNTHQRLHALLSQAAASLR